MHSRRQFWAYWDDTHPALFDAFAKNGTVLLVFTVRDDLCSRCKPMTRVFSAGWACSFPGQSAVPGTLVANPKGPVNTILVECRIPGPLRNKTDLSVRETLSVSYREAGAAAHHYKDVPYCRYPAPGHEALTRGAHPARGATEQAAGPGRARVPLAACTMLKSNLTRYGVRNSDLLVEWIEYHRLQGVGHFLVYAHEDPAPLRRLLAPHIAAGLATVVDWEPPPYRGRYTHRGADFVPFQYLQTTSCLHRYRGLAEWVGLFDIDEFMQPLAIGATVRSAVFTAAAAADASGDDVAALKVAGVYFFERDGRRWGNSSLLTQRHLKRDRKWRFEVSKCFGRPERIQLYQQHFPILGGAVVELDPVREIRFNHYRDTRFDAAQDDSMGQYRAALEASVARARRLRLRQAAERALPPSGSLVFRR